MKYPNFIYKKYYICEGSHFASTEILDTLPIINKK